ncbi:hypothetical protein [Sorangium cellulosum]|uniref:hypothetical protein n=1 Tax=Sorangium cellulosum TaxID=56 RepID=UPI001F1B7950|nr:hypothetical protein [Sorangium cellulosum]
MVEGVLMSRMHDVLRRFRGAPNVRRADNPFRLVSSVSSAAGPGEIDAAWHPREIPDEVTSMWCAARSARLFEDADYGQWGLVILDPQASRLRTDAERLARPRDFRDDDIILGEFLGDQELLVVAPSESGIRRVLVALPLDPRSDWPGAAKDLAAFLDDYFDAGGNKYWEGGPV